MTARSTVVLAALLAATACGARDPTTGTTNRVAQVRDGSTPTLLVTNSTCVPGPCMAFEVRGIVSAPSFNVPGQPQSGFVFLGNVDSASACLRFPASLPLRLIRANSATGRTDTLLSTWTVSDPVALVATYSAVSASLGRTAEFIPAGSAGWQVTLPGGTEFSMPIPSERCVQ